MSTNPAASAAPATPSADAAATSAPANDNNTTIITNPIEDDFSSIVIDGSLGGPKGGKEGEPEPEPDPKPGDPKPGETVPDEATVFTLGDENFEISGAVPQETDREKQLREQNEELQKKLDARQNENSQHQPQELIEPGLYDAGIDGDQEKYNAALRAYDREVGKREALQAEETRKQEEWNRHDQSVWESNIQRYDQRRAEIRSKIPEVDVADAELTRILSPLHQAALMSATLENPEMVALALHKSEAWRNRFMAEKNPVRLGVMLAQLSQKAQLAPQAKTKVSAEPVVNASQGVKKPAIELDGDLSSAEFI